MTKKRMEVAARRVGQRTMHVCVYCGRRIRGRGGFVMHKNACKARIDTVLSRLGSSPSP